MKFGGHQTFFIRDGWLYKALTMLIEDQDREMKLLTHEYSADYLGVGKNMAMAIRHWLIATGLAIRNEEKYYEPTKLAKIIYENDKYFVNLGTWWVLHTNLVHSKENSFGWNWFFNDFNFERFDRSMCRDLLMRTLSLSKGRVPSENTVDRDLICMLSSYSRYIPSTEKDPEEAIESPFRELNLMNYYRDSAMYKINKGRKDVNIYIFMYVISLLLFDETKSIVDITFYDLVNLKNGPSKIFQIDNESLFELLVRINESAVEQHALQIRGLAGERQLLFMNKSPLYWIDEYYKKVNG